MQRIDVRAILSDPVKRRALMVDSIQALQARAGISTTKAQAERAYDAVRAEKRVPGVLPSVMRDGYEWVAAPVHGHYEHGKRWRLTFNGWEAGRVVQLLPLGLWEARTEAWYSPGHLTLKDASRALWRHVNPTASLLDAEAIARRLSR